MFHVFQCVLKQISNFAKNFELVKNYYSFNKKDNFSRNSNESVQRSSNWEEMAEDNLFNF